MYVIQEQRYYNHPFSNSPPTPFSKFSQACLLALRKRNKNPLHIYRIVSLDDVGDIEEIICTFSSLYD